VIALVFGRILRRHGRHDVDLEHHAGPRELHHVEQCVRRQRVALERLRAARAHLVAIADVGDVGGRLDDVGDGGAVFLQQLADLLPGEAALREEVVLVADRAVVLVFRADAGEVDHLRRAGDGDDFGEGALGEFAVVEVLLFERLRVGGAGEHQQDGGGGGNALHVYSPSDERICTRIR
jgi:hypothetical protein